MIKHPTFIFHNKNITVFPGMMICFSTVAFSRTKSKGAFYTNDYSNLFHEAGYSQRNIDAKVDTAYHDLFEDLNKVYFEVGDSMV